MEIQGLIVGHKLKYFTDKVDLQRVAGPMHEFIRMAFAYLFLRGRVILERGVGERLMSDEQCNQQHQRTSDDLSARPAMIHRMPHC